MSKSLLIVICDFLLLSLLSIANFDKPDKTNAQKKEADAALQSETFVQTQMLETLKTALDAEQQRHAALSENVQQLSKNAEENVRKAGEREKIIREREEQLEQIKRAKSELEVERERILTRSRELETRVLAADKRNEALQSEIVSAVDRLEKSADERLRLERQIGEMRRDDADTKSKLRDVQQELLRNRENLERLRVESDKLKLENRAIEAEKVSLATQLQVAATKTQIYAENLKRAQTLIDIEKVEKEKAIEHAQTLSTNVSTLADSQKKLSEDIGNIRGQTASELFANVEKFFVDAVFKYSEGGLLGREHAVLKLRTLPIFTDGKVRLFFERGSTPVRFMKEVRAPEKLEITVSAGGKIWVADKVASLRSAGSVLMLELPDGFVEKKNALTLAEAKNTYRFADCVVINPEKKYYGQVPFMANFTRKEYAKLDVGLVDSIFNKFSPAASDIAVSRSGDALGVLVSSTDLFIPREVRILKVLPLNAGYNKAAFADFVK